MRGIMGISTLDLGPTTDRLDQNLERGPGMFTFNQPPRKF